ncbi:MAG TPA: amino acid permease, partial [Sphingomonas sp.]|nr:amino acid permease [Sphingomonas sp.]
PWLTAGPLILGGHPGGFINLPAGLIALLMTWLLMIGTTESARVNAILVAIKIAALTLFCVLTLPVVKGAEFHPFIPNGWGTIGVVGAASSIFFAYVGFDAVSTAAEETRNPQRNVPIGLIGSLLICTIFYLLVSAGAIGAVSDPAFAQPVRGFTGAILAPGTPELAQRCAAIAAAGATQPLACSHEALAYVLRTVGYQRIGDLIGIAAFIALPSVVLMMMYGQTRIFFTMARDGLLPGKLASVHPRWRTPHIVTAFTGVVVVLMAAFLPVGTLADYSNSGTLFAFFMVAVSVLVLRRKDPERKRPFRTPAIWLVAPLAIIGCVILYAKLPLIAILVLPVWGAIGLLIYFGYSRRRSYVGRGIIDVEDDEPPIYGVEA